MSKRPSWIDQTLGGRYKIEKLLGQGGMSAVYKATDPNLRRDVAIKLIHSHLAADEQFVRRFEEEAAAVAQLRHPHIIQVHDFNPDDEDACYMVLEFVAGETLGERLERLAKQSQKLAIEEAIPLMAKLTSAVHYAHHQGMVHRDLKPANVMIREEDGEPVLMDFGIVKMMQNAGHTASGVVMGTMSYMAPEQIRGEPVDHRIDIYALGVVLFEVLVGEKPFDGESTVTTMMKHLNEPPPDLIELNPDIPYELAEIVYKAMEKDPELRYQSAVEMGQALYQAGSQLGIVTVNHEIGTAAIAIPADATEVYRPLNTMMGESLPTVQHRQARTKEVNVAGEAETAPPAQSWKSLLTNQFAIGAFVLVALMAIAAVTLGRQRLQQQSDDDGDGLTYGQEMELGTDPNSSDSDQDRVPDAEELELGTDPTKADTDGDGLTDQNEKAVLCLDPLVPDTDRDGVLDGADDAPCEGIASGSTVSVSARIVAIEIEELVAIEASSSGSGYYDDEVQTDPAVVDTAGEVVTELRYVVTFETDGFVPEPQQTHVHFYYNNIAETESGLPGNGPWEIHQNSDSFNRFRLADRPQDATEICIIAAGGDHNFIEGTGGCMSIPAESSQ